MFHIKPTFLNFLGRLRESCFHVSYFPNISLSTSHNKKYRPLGQYSLLADVYLIRLFTLIATTSATAAINSLFFGFLYGER